MRAAHPTEKAVMAESRASDGEPSPGVVIVATDAPISKKKLKKTQKVTRKLKAVGGSADKQVQHTNDDSVVSKRSAVAHHYVRDDFLRHFVRKPSRRSPLINRGYYLRMAVMADLVVQLIRAYLEAPERSDAAPADVTPPASRNPPPVQVLSLGAGYDTLALRLLLDSVNVRPATEGSAVATSAVAFPSGEVLFMDVDFPAVLQSKSALLAAAPPHTFPKDWQLAPHREDCPIRGPHYAAVGIDLRSASTELVPRLRAHGPAGFAVTHPTIIYAECVMQYMPPDDATRLITCLASSFPNAIFVAYDQVAPADSFGRVMQASLRQKSSPLLGIQATPDGAHMTRRAHAAGMHRVWWSNFYKVSNFCIAGAEQERVESLEDFDELEEWSEMCEHYGLTMAVTPCAWESVVDAGCARHSAFVEYTKDGAPVTEGTADKGEVEGPALEPVPPVRGSLHSWPSARFGFEGWGNGGVAVEPLPNGDRLLISFGGFAAGKQHQRVNTVFAHSLQEGELQVAVAAAATDIAPPPLIFHSFSRIGPGQYLVWGGRTNPSAPSNAAFLLSIDVPRTVSLGGNLTARWSALAKVPSIENAGGSIPSPRYRHCMVPLCSTQDEAVLLLLGGKSRGIASPTATGLECYRVTVSKRCSTIAYEALHDAHFSRGQKEGNTSVAPPSLHSAAALAISPEEVLLSGGVLSGRASCNPFLWKLHVPTMVWTRLPVRLGAGRYSHSLTRVTVDRTDSILLLGGSSYTEKSRVPPAVLVPCSLISGCADTVPAPEAAPVVLSEAAPWWSRHSCVALGDGVVGVVGGGYTCFSFGTFAAKPQLLHLGNTTAASVGSDRQGCGEATTSGGAPLTYSYDRLLSKPWATVREVAKYTAAAFLAAAHAAAEPVVFRNAPLGACVSRWNSSAYLTQLEGPTTVSVHIAEGSQLLDFVRKNFTFRHMALAQLVQHLEEATRNYRATGQTPNETYYYRSVASHMKSERSNLWVDFPTLGKDFVLPPGAKEYIEPRLHQSCLRMNAPPLQLWTHYDTLDNVLCQIVGSKRVVLFPPSALTDLYMTGSSSAVINLDAPDLVRYPRFIEACKSAQEVVLRPGDMLFFPAMWFHHITTLSPEEEEAGGSGSVAAPYNISVNVFYRHFSDASVYDAKDLYGNKDILAVTRLRERLLEVVQDTLADAQLTMHANGQVEKVPIPAPYREFALREFLQVAEAMATTMATTYRAAGQPQSE